MLTQEEAARLLGMKTSEVVSVQTIDRDTVIVLHDRSRVVVPADGPIENWEFRPPADPASTVDTPAPPVSLPAGASVLPEDWRERLRDWWDTGAVADSVIELIESWVPGDGDGDQADEPAEELDTLPDGPVGAVLSWVADDPGRAVLARNAEQLREQPRSSLLAQLDKIIGGAA